METFTREKGEVALSASERETQATLAEALTTWTLEKKTTNPYPSHCWMYEQINRPSY